MKRVLLVLSGTVWGGFWFWTFSLAQSSGFFLYDRQTRVPIFLACLIGVSALPVSGYVQWRRAADGVVPRMRAFGVHLVWSAAALGLPLMLTFVFSRASGSWRLEADDAMGVAIDLASIFLVAGGISLVLGLALVLRGPRHTAGVATIARQIGHDDRRALRKRS